MIEFGSVSKVFAGSHAPALKDVSFSVEPGSIVGLVGFNGSGKTTLIRIAAGVVKPTGGSVRIDGSDVRSDRVGAGRGIGWVSDENRHDIAARVRTLLTYYRRLLGDVPEQRLRDDLEYWGLNGYQHLRVGRLSLGGRRRLGLLIADLQRPRYILLDEVFNGLDADGMNKVREWMSTRREEGTGFLIASHNLRELQEVVDRAIVLDLGEVVGSIDRSAIQARSWERIRVDVDSDLDVARRILEAIGKVSTAHGSLTVWGTGLTPSCINRRLVEAGVQVSALQSTGDSLEDLVIELTEMGP